VQNYFHACPSIGRQGFDERLQSVSDSTNLQLRTFVQIRFSDSGAFGVKIIQSGGVPKSALPILLKMDTATQLLIPSQLGMS
jgi:hypothetical protein